MTQQRSEEIRRLVDIMVREEGRERTLDLLVTRAADIPDDELGEWARHCLQGIRNISPDTWPDDVITVVLDSFSSSVSERVRMWELESLAHNADDRVRAAMVGRLSHALRAGRPSQKVRAARAFMTLGELFDGLGEDLTAAYQASDSYDDRASLLSVCAYFHVLSPETLLADLSQLAGEAEVPSETLCYVIGAHGDPALAEALVRAVRGGSHTAMISLMELASRHADDRELIQLVTDLYFGVERRVVWGLEHYAARLFDDERFVRSLLEAALAALAGDAPGLVESNLLTRCNRKSHIAYLQRRGATMPQVEKEVLRSLVIESSGSTHRGETHETIRKEAALTIASRLGLADLKTWMAEGISNESANWLVSRMAKECCFWNVPDFVVGLAPRMQNNDDTNPIWLVADESGAVGGDRTLEILLDSDGRFKHEHAVLATYVDGLAMAAKNVGSTARLTRAMNDQNRPSWTRQGAAHAVRQAATYREPAEIDWNAVQAFIQEPENDEATRHELLISVASHRPQLALALVEGLTNVEQTRSRVLLAKIIANGAPDEVLAELRRYEAPAPSPYQRNFEDGYACLCVARMYGKGQIPSDQAVRLLETGLVHEADAFVLALEQLRADDLTLRDLAERTVFDGNSEWRSHPALWSAMERLGPGWLLQDHVREHVKSVSDHAVKGYLDALIEIRDRLAGSTEVIWRLLTDLALNRERAVAWYACYAGSVLCSEVAMQWVADIRPTTDREVRMTLEVAHWLDDATWDHAVSRLANARQMDIRSYARQLEMLRRRNAIALSHWQGYLDTTQELDGWIYIQALLEMPCEPLSHCIRQWRPEPLRLWTLRHWLIEKHSERLKKAREKLLRNGSLPGEAAFPRWFM